MATLGFTGIGTTEAPIQVQGERMFFYEGLPHAKVSKLSIYLKQAASATAGHHLELKGLLYANEGGLLGAGAKPGLLLGETAVLNVAFGFTAGFFELNFVNEKAEAIELEVPAGAYWIGFMTGPETGSTKVCASWWYNVVANDLQVNSRAWPKPVPEGKSTAWTTENRQGSLFITYTEIGTNEFEPDTPPSTSLGRVKYCINAVHSPVNESWDKYAEPGTKYSTWVNAHSSLVKAPQLPLPETSGNEANPASYWKKLHSGALSVLTRFEVPSMLIGEEGGTVYTPLSAANRKKFLEERIELLPGLAWPGVSLMGLGLALAFRDVNQSPTGFTEFTEIWHLVQETRTGLGTTRLLEFESQWGDLSSFILKEEGTEAQQKKAEEIVEACDIIMQPFGIGYQTKALESGAAFAKFLEYVDALHLKGAQFMLGGVGGKVEAFGYSEAEWFYQLAAYYLIAKKAENLKAERTVLAGDFITSNGTLPPSTPTTAGVATVSKGTWWTGWESELGPPEGNRQALGAGLYVREFEHGFVAVLAPGEPERTVNLPNASEGRKWHSLSGAVLSSPVTLKGREVEYTEGAETRKVKLGAGLVAYTAEGPPPPPGEGEPKVTNPGNQRVGKGPEVKLKIVAENATAAEPYSAVNLPKGLSISKTTGEITGKPTTEEEPECTVTVENAAKKTASTKFKWLVIGLPVITAPASLTEYTFEQNVAISNIAVIAAEDARKDNCEPNTYKFSGSKKAPEGIVVNETTGIISGTPTTVNETFVEVGIQVENIASGHSEVVVKMKILPKAGAPALPKPKKPADRVDHVKDKIAFQVALEGGSGPVTSWTLTSPPNGISITEAGEVHGEPSKTYIPAKNVKVTATNASGSAIVEFKWEVLEQVATPVAPATQHSTINKPIAPFIVAHTGGVPAKWRMEKGPEGIAINELTGEISGEPKKVETDKEVKVIAENSGGSGSASFEWIVENIPPPELTQPANQESLQFQQASLTIQNKGGPVASWKASGLPEGMSITTSGVIEGKPLKTGAFSITVTAENLSGSSSKTFTWTVKAAPPSVTNPGAQFSIVNKPITPLPIQSLGAEAGGYSATGLPTGLSIKSSGTIEGTPTVVGEFKPTVNVKGTGGTTPVSFTWTVEPPANPWTVILDPPQAIGGRVPLNLNKGPIMVEQAGINWGDAAIEAFSATQLYGQVPSDYRVPNRIVEIPLFLSGEGAQAEKQEEEARTELREKVGLIQRQGGALRRQRANGEPVYADVVNATLTLPDKLAESAAVEPNVILKLECIPDFYGEEVELDPIEGTGQVIGVLRQGGQIASIPGDYPARCRVVLSEKSANRQVSAIWGFRSTRYDSRAGGALFFDASALTPINGAEITAVANRYSGKVVKLKTPEPGLWHPFLLTDVATTGQRLLHVGTYRVWARCFTNVVGQQVGLMWSDDDASAPTENAPTTLTTTAGQLVDLGEIRIEEPPEGEHWWRGVLRTFGPSEISVDRLWLQPLDDGGGRLIATAKPTGTILAKAKQVVPGSSEGTFESHPQGTGRPAWHKVFAEPPYPENTPETGVTPQVELKPHGVIAAESQELRVANFVAKPPFTFPAGRQIIGLALQVGYWIGDSIIPVVLTGNLIGLGASKSVVLQNQGTATLGGATDLWGQSSIASTELNSGSFGFAFIATNLGGGTLNVQVRSVVMTVYYALAGQIVEADAVMYPQRQAEVRTVGAYRQDNVTAAYIPISSVLGDLPRLPPSGMEGRQCELLVKQSRGNLAEEPDSGIDAVGAQVFFRPTFLGRI